MVYFQVFFFPSVAVVISKAPYCVPLLSLTEDLLPQCVKRKEK